MTSAPGATSTPTPRRPLIGLASVFIPGVALGLALRVNPLYLLVLGGVTLVVGFLLIRWPLSSLALYAALFVSGATAGTLSIQHPSPRALGSMMEHAREYVSIVGVIARDPLARAGKSMEETRWTLFVRVEGIRRLAGYQRARGCVRIETTAHASRPYRYGDRGTWTGLLVERQRKRPGTPTHAMYADAALSRVLSRGHGSMLLAWCLDGRKACAGVLARGIEDYSGHVGLLRALLLGYRQELPTTLRRSFGTTGTLHIFAISGLHVGVMAILVIGLLKALGVSRQFWILGLAPALIVYTLGTGMKASAVRACVMALVYWSAPFFRRKPDGPSSLALAALVILSCVPTQLADPGFLFSFVVVAGILAIYPRIASVALHRFRRDPWKVQREPVWVRWPRALTAKIGALAAVSLAAWLVSAPLTAYYFNIFSPVALLGNVLVIPAAFLVVLTGCLSLVLGSSFVLAAEVFNHANRVFISALLWAIDLIGHVPWGHCFVRAPSAAGVVAYYVVLAGWLSARSWLRRLTWLFVGLAIFLGAGLWGGRRRVTVDVADTGQGSAALVNLPGDRDVLIDTGPRFYATRLLRHLQRQGVDRLGVLVLSHAEADRVGGALAVIQNMPVAELWCSRHRGRSRVYDAVLAEARARGVRVRFLERGCRGVWPGGVEWEVLHPPGGTNYTRAADASLVLRVAREGASVLFMDGAGDAAADAMLCAAVDPTAAVLVADGRADRDAFTAEWLDAVQPDHVVLRAGRGHRGGDPHPDTMRRLATRRVRVWRTDEQACEAFRVELLAGRAARRADRHVGVSLLQR